MRLRALTFLLAACCCLAAEDRPSVGAIRWDAWSGGAVTREVERTLGPPAHRHRLPWFAQFDDQGRASIDASAPGVMEAEIGYAKTAGLDYWAFLTYPEGDAMGSALERYLRSPRRKEIGFCLILHQSLTVAEGRWPAERDRTLRLIREPGYRRALDRPLVYTFDVNPDSPTTRRRLDELRGAAKSSGGEPYFVHMGWHPSSDHARRSKEGYAAVSAYAHPSEEPAFWKYVESLERHAWADARTHKVPFVPLVSAGWDKRPRQDHPVSWEKDAAYLGQKTFPAAGTPDEIAAHLQRALSFVRDNPEVCPARTVIIYAWNEHDEGGWLCPTWTPDGRPDTSRLDAVRKVLSP